MGVETAGGGTGKRPRRGGRAALASLVAIAVVVIMVGVFVVRRNTAPPTDRAQLRPGAAAPATGGPSARAAKKGVGAWTFPGVDQALEQSTATWYYTWSTNHAGVSTPPGVDFVPMVWGAADATPSALGQARAGGRVLLGFNEPDEPTQANMTVEQALDLWPALMATGLTLGSPAVATRAAMPGGWLDRFMAGAASRGYRVDFVAVHWYGADFTTAHAVDQLRSYLTAVHDRYHKPVWLTEFALVDFPGGYRYPGQEVQAAFLAAAAPMLADLDFVRRYAWFALPVWKDAPATGLYRDGPVPTEVGRAFATVD